MRLKPNHSHYLIILAGALLVGVGWYWYGHQERNQTITADQANSANASVLSAQDEATANANLQPIENVNTTSDEMIDTNQAEPQTQTEPDQPEPVKAPQTDYIKNAHLAEFIDGQAGPAASVFPKDSRLLLVLETSIRSGQKVESKIAVEKAGGARIGDEQTYELHDGEIVIANPGRAGAYTAVIRVGDTETRQIEFKIE